MPDGTISVSGPTASRGVHLELDLALGDRLGSRIRTLIRAGETARQAAPADLHDALKTIADDRTVRQQVRRLASDLAGRIDDAMRRHPTANRFERPAPTHIPSHANANPRVDSAGRICRTPHRVVLE